MTPNRRRPMWLTATLALTALAALGGVTLLAAGSVGARRWAARTRVLKASLAKADPGAAPYSTAELEGLPAPVARFFHHVLREGQPLIRSAEIEWTGEFNLGRPGRDNWRPFTARQLFVPGAPGFVWDARIQMLPAVPILVRDSFVDGGAAMTGAALGLVPVVDSYGTDTLASGALQRYLGEAVWFPTALLPREGVSWTAIDDSRARASLTAGRTTVSLEFRFDAAGNVTSVFTPDRWYDDGKGAPVPRPWEATNRRFEAREGVVVPVDSTVAWDLPAGRFEYWRGHPVLIRYEAR